MSIPLDRLYHYIESIAREVRESDVVIYRFLPHGSKKAEDLHQLQTYSWTELVVLPEIYCNDQEPLNYDLYPSGANLLPHHLEPLQQNKIQIPDNLNFKKGFFNIYDNSILLHSEQRSSNLEQYQTGGFIPVYYWSHAVLARDWFRYAEHFQQTKSVERRFLIYNRAWSGTREYRMGFTDRLIRLGLVDHTVMRVNPVDSTINKHYDLHEFEHPHWRPHNVIENYFPLCDADSTYSADFDQDDYESTDIEVVLETLFDDLRLHLTEKTLRPIAMGQPFILASTYGSLKYLRDYGFKTFADCWDESYDMMSDSIERMNKITEVMSDIVSMPPAKRDEMLVRARAIADYNRQYFFSKEFEDLIINELKSNFKLAFDYLESTNTSSRFFHYRKLFAQTPELKEIVTGLLPDKSRQDIVNAVKQARKYYISRLNRHPKLLSY